MEEGNINTLTSTASAILQKVNNAIANKRDVPSKLKISPLADKHEEEDDVLELLEEAIAHDVPHSPPGSGVSSKSPATEDLKTADSISAEEKTHTAEEIRAEQKSDDKEYNPANSQEFDTEKFTPPAINVINDINNTNSSDIMKEKLVSDNTAQKTAELFNKLKETARSVQSSDNVKFRSGTTVEDIIIELVRPYLKEWLDEHLPSIVKNAVEKEVKKLIPNEE